jgi:hypothetical protein
MRNIVSITSAAPVTALVQLARVKQEFGITGTTDDALLTAKIAEASDDVAAALGFVPWLETVSETFWHEGQFEYPEYLILNRTPVTSIASVTVDGCVLDPSRYRLDAATGLLYALSASGWPEYWQIQQGAVIAYAGGYLLPGQDGRTLPAGIEGAALSLMQSFWAARGPGRDPNVRSEETQGIGRIEYWVGTVGDPDQLPDQVLRKLAPFRRAVV